MYITLTMCPLLLTSFDYFSFLLIKAIVNKMCINPWKEGCCVLLRIVKDHTSCRNKQVCKHQHGTERGLVKSNRGGYQARTPAIFLVVFPASLIRALIRSATTTRAISCTIQVPSSTKVYKYVCMQASGRR